jgi:predicted alpha/beta-hydrolase family hydrolase
MATVSAAYQYAKKHNPKLPLFLSGKSFGGRMSSQWLATESFPSIKGLICFGFPLHPAGKPSIIRAAHLPQIKFPMLFLQGTKDALADLTLLQSVLNDIPNATLITFDKANHGFQIGKRDVIEELAEATALWIRAQLKLK